VHILHRDLKPIEGPGFSDFDITGELFGQVFDYDAVTGCEECQHHLDEVLLLRVEFLPVFMVVGQVYFVVGPE